MSKASVWLLAAATCLGMASPALARHHRSHHRVAHHVRRGVIPDVLVANPYGDVIVDGKTGYHRSTFGVMVPDTAPASFIATGRASGTGLGANGLPGSNWQ